jgi:putative ATP-dependent endonuclease of the OLD family
MRLSRVHIINFRCLQELVLELDDVTTLVGANSTGKSTALHALRWLFEGGPLEEEDFWGCDDSLTVSVGATFTGFSDADRLALGSYLVQEEATFWRTWSTAEHEKLTGRGLAYRPFEDIRAHEKATPMKVAYNELRTAHLELGLSAWTNQQAAKDEMKSWEEAHPDLLSESTVSATHLFGFTGGSRLNGRFDYVLVPAISDPEAETRDAPRTLLRQLLDRVAGDKSSLQQHLSALETDVAERLRVITQDESGEMLERLSESVSDELQRLVPGGRVLLQPEAPRFKMPDLAVRLRVEEGGLETEVGRQGHGFQRALLIAIVHQLASLRPPATPNDHEAVQPAPDVQAGSEASEDPPRPISEPPALFLALEEPELYQHPAQARHFAATLASLAGAGETVQVAYATHSEHFVDPARYERLRRFRRRVGVDMPTGDVTRATVEGVGAKLADIIDADQVELRIRMTLRRQLAEAVFARAVLICEGRTDGGLLSGIADRSGGFDADGIAVVHTGGKTQLAISWAILEELGVPTYVVFDGDSGCRARLQAQGKPEAEVAQAEANAQLWNRRLLGLLGADVEDWPQTSISKRYAIFGDRLEADLANWAGWLDECGACQEELGAWRAKSEDVYRLAASRLATDPPEVFAQLISALRLLG